jgi:hypothetical protein
MEQWMPTAAMVATNVVIAIMTALIKQALNQGMNRLVLITFRQLVATVFLGPIAYFKERYIVSKAKGKMNSNKATAGRFVRWYFTVSCSDHALLLFLYNSNH